ncbi:MAG: D-alpha,beta-d-heptose 7-phosphate 1-kinase, d-beta-d-heptose 1-phosphate adenylyltransferase [Conexibacter sp.]|nr:D-alpha,beta-d-heptose 7-phosphate 1-kinase, d-beta-d-heptose 1-phosphate adenylyltransferase [Conexibacter sp.]
MAATSGVLSQDVNFADRLVPSLEEMSRVVSHLRGLGYRIVLTSGSFDLIHLGHVKYLARAKELGGILVVGVDSDAKIRRRKGDDRPMVPEDERLELLAHQRPVDLIYLKQDEDPSWGLIKAVEPDVLVLTADHSYSDEQLARLREVVGEIAVIERQAAVTTSERIRQMYMNLGDKLGPKLAEILPGLIDETIRRG